VPTPTPTPFDTVAWHAAFDASTAAFQADALDLLRLAIFALVLVGGVVATGVLGTLVASLRGR